MKKSSQPDTNADSLPPEPRSENKMMVAGRPTPSLKEMELKNTIRKLEKENFQLKITCEKLINDIAALRDELNASSVDKSV